MKANHQIMNHRSGFERKISNVFIFLISFFCLCENASAYRYLDREAGHDFILVGVGVFRQNFTTVDGDEMGFEESDDGLPSDYSNRSRVSLYGEGNVYNDYTFELDCQYNEEYDASEDLTFYLKAERDDDYLILGDHRDGAFEETVFTALDRKIRGVTLHGQKDEASATFMGGALKGENAVDVIDADGTSGPYRLEDAPIVQASERVNIQTRDRNSPDRVIRSSLQTRGADYSIDYDAGEIVFRSPVDRTDVLGNPVVIVVSYQFESVEGMYNRSVYGSRFTARPFDPVRFGATILAEGPWNSGARETWDERRQILGADMNAVITNRYRAGFEAAKSEVPGLEDSTESDAMRIQIDADPVDRLKVYGRYWKAERDFLTFGNSDLESGTVYENVETGKPFEFSSAATDLDLDPNIDSDLGVDQESGGVSATYEIGDYDAVSAGFRNTHTNVPEDELFLKDTTRSTFASYKHIRPEKTDFLVGAETIDRFDNESPKTMDSRTTRLVGAVTHPLGNYGKVGAVNLAAAYQFEDYDDKVDESFSIIVHDLIGRVESLPNEDLMFYFEQAEQWVYEKAAHEYTFRRDTSVLGVTGKISERLDIDATAKYRTLHDLVANNVDEIEQVYTFRLDGRPFEKLRTGFRAEYRSIEYPSLEPEEEEERIILGGDVTWNVRSDFTARTRYDYEIEKTSAGEESIRDDFLIRLNYKRRNRFSLFGYYRIEHDRIEDAPFAPTRSELITTLIGTKYKFTPKIETTAAYRIKHLNSETDDRREKYFVECGYWITRYFQAILGFEHFKYENEEDEEANYEADVGYISLVVKL